MQVKYLGTGTDDKKLIAHIYEISDPVPHHLSKEQLKEAFSQALDIFWPLKIKQIKVLPNKVVVLSIKKIPED